MADRLDGYVMVNDRLKEFLRDHQDGRIVTQAKAFDTDGVVNRWTVRAEVYLGDTLVATGYSSMEVPGKTAFTRSSELENTETSAVGRALGFLGYGIDKSIATVEEIKSKSVESTSSGNDLAITGWVEALREDGFALKAGSTTYKVVALPGVAAVGEKVKVTGPVELVPWTDAQGRKRPPYKRLTASTVTPL